MESYSPEFQVNARYTYIHTLFVMCVSKMTAETHKYTMPGLGMNFLLFFFLVRLNNVYARNAREFSFPKYHIWKSSLWPQKNNSLTTTLHMHHAFMSVSLLSLHDYDMKMPNFTFCRRQWSKITSCRLQSLIGQLSFLLVPTMVQLCSVHYAKMNVHKHRTKQTYESYTFQPLMSFR